MPTINLGNLENQEKILKRAAENKDLLLQILASVDSLQEFNWRKYWTLQRTGRIFTVRKYDHSVSTSTTLEKLDDNAGRVMVPATDTDPGTNDYADEPMFKYLTVNATVDEDGNHHITAVEGDGTFSRDGSNGNVFVMYMPWFVRTVKGEGYTDISVSDIMHEGFIPIKPAIAPDGTIAPFMLFAAYHNTGYGGKPSSVSGGKIPRNRSYSNNIAYFSTLGSQYCSMASWDWQFIQLLMMIKYGTTNSQSIMRGCTSYNLQKKVAVAEADTTRVILATSDASGYVAGSCVSVGDVGSETNLDRGQSYIHNIADNVKILSIETVTIDATEYTALNLDVVTLTTTVTTYVTTMHWHTGATDNVLGPDGSPVSNTSGKYPCRIGGIEIHCGGYDVIANVVFDYVTTDDVTAIDVYVCDDAAKLTTDAAAIRSTYKKIGQIPNTAGAWKYITELLDDYANGISIPAAVGGGGESIGYADGLITNAATSGLFECLALGSLHYGGGAGAWCLDANGGVSGAWWALLARLSPNGRRGEWVA